MANLKEIRSRISSVSSTMQITSAMKMVSAAKLKKAQNAVIQIRPYANKLEEILGNVTESLDVADNSFAEKRSRKNLLVVAVTSNKGLCGGFNNAIIKDVKKMINKDYSDHSISVLSIGKKAYDAFKNSDYKIEGDYLPKECNELFENLNFEQAASVAEQIMNAFTAKHIDKAVIVYNSFKNAATQIVTREQFLPVSMDENEASSNKNEASKSKMNADYIFEPDKESILEEIIPKTLKIKLYKALLDSNASEHGARMTAMHKATDNADEIKGDLQIKYNKARQASITNEILEIVAGADALEG